MAQELLMIGIICDQFISRRLSSGLAELYEWKSFGLQSQGEIKEGDFYWLCKNVLGVLICRNLEAKSVVEVD